MNENNLHRIDELEAVFAEQDLTIQTLSDVIARQDREINQLLQRLGQLEDLVKSMRESMPAGAEGSAFEKPPHY